MKKTINVPDVATHVRFWTTDGHFDLVSVPVSDLPDCRCDEAVDAYDEKCYELSDIRAEKDKEIFRLRKALHNSMPHKDLMRRYDILTSRLERAYTRIRELEKQNAHLENESQRYWDEICIRGDKIRELENQPIDACPYCFNTICMCKDLED